MQDYTPQADSLKDRVILVTGAGVGIGATAAKTFARCGATVVLLGRTIAKLEKVYDEIKAAGGPEPAIYPLNLEGANSKDYETMALSIKSELGQLNGILHNAALLGDLMPIQQYETDLWLKVMQINLNAPLMMTRACIDVLQQSDDPRVVFTLHDTNKAYWGAYGVAKAGLRGLGSILADELDTKLPITVNMVNPGEVQCPMMSRAFPGKDLKQLATAESIMPTYVYLMSKESRHVTGQVFNAQET